MSSQPIPRGDQWKDVRFVQQWKAEKKQALERRWQKKPPAAVISAPLLEGVVLSAVPELRLEIPDAARELLQWENESLLDRAHRLEDAPRKPKSNRNAAQARHQVPAMIGKDDRGSWVLSPIVSRATPEKLIKSKAMYDGGLEKKAQREIACGLLGGEVVCRSGHAFRVAYECGNRYCVRCGPRQANRLFAQQHDRLFFVATRLMLCGQEECAECNTAIEQKRLPHWPPPRGARPRVVCAKIDFTLRHTRGDQLPAPERMRELNQMIKKFCRAIEKQFGIDRSQYGLAYCDELGGNNSNPHAHGLYVGPWLPQEKKQLSALWQKITGGSFILSIKYAHDFSKALFHAVKYPAKFAQRSSPQRLADLEKVFHRVRRFHTLASFYAPEAPAVEKPPLRRCPRCDEILSEPRGWQSIAELTRRGLEDLEAVRGELARSRGLGDLPPP